MMLGEETRSADYWKAAGDAALAHNIKGIVIMGAHWDCKSDHAVQVSMTPNPAKQPVANVAPSKYKDYKLNADLETPKKCIQIPIIRHTLCGFSIFSSYLITATMQHALLLVEYPIM